MISMKTVLVTGLALAPFAFGAAHASDPDEFTLQPIGVTSTSTVIYSPETYTTGTSTIVTQPVNTGTSGFQDVDINDYLIQDNSTSN